MEEFQGVISRAGEKRVIFGTGGIGGAAADGEGKREERGSGPASRRESLTGQEGGPAERALERNEVAIEFGAQSRNESFARMVAAAYAAQLNPTLEEISDIKTAVSEAVTNAVIHGYNGRNGTVRMKLALAESEVLIEITDYGRGMENVLLAMEPMYTTRADMERSGMGFAFMEAFMDELEVRSAPGRGTVVRMRKRIAPMAREE
ncbi:MAG: anti-sigma F factor [Lachnospiraceae bacterium]|nr:anti-sigma F factor [Lachnospiraceae bacterium]